jgi:hypothetical protein
LRDDIGRQESHWEQMAHISIGDAFGLGDLVK